MGLTLLASTMCTPNSSSNVTVREYGTAISNAFANAGWIQANDAGQIDWTTVVANGTSGVYIGSEIWRMNDALANVTPCYIKIDYGTAGGTGRPQFNFALGHSSNGSLGLRGAITSNISLAFSGSAGTYYPCYFHGDNASIGIVMFDTYTYSFVIAIERSKDANGVNTAEGFYVLSGMSPYITQFFWSPWTGQSQSTPESVGAFTPSAALSTGTGSTFNWSPVFLSSGKFFPPMLNWALGSNTHFASNTAITLTHYGAAHQYRCGIVYVTTPRSQRSSSLLMRWE